MATTTFAKPNAAVLAAKGRRAEASVRWKWRIDQVLNTVDLSMKKRVKLATAFLHDRVVRNINISVVRGTGPRGGKIFIRSKPGEFPRAETTQLKKTLFSETRKASNGTWSGYIGTPLDYGLILETRMKRSFLVRTLNQERGTTTRILTVPIK